MTLFLARWSPATDDGTAALVVALSPPDGVASLTAPDGARVSALDDDGMAEELQRVGERWPTGRVFGAGREVLWRCEGRQRVVVLAADPPPDTGGLPSGWAVCEEAASWRAVEHDEARPGQLFLFDPGDQRLPVPPVYPARLTGRGPLAVKVQEYDGVDGVAWRRYVSIEEVEG